MTRSMLWKFNKKTTQKKLLASLSENELRLFVVKYKNGQISVQTSATKQYDSEQALEEEFLNWCLDNKLKGLECHWLLSRKLYQTYSVKSPAVSRSELDASIKWLVKDQITQPLNETLVSHYEPFQIDISTSQITAVVTDKSRVETLINLSEKSGLNLKTIEIIELSACDILAAEINKEKVVGLIDEDEQGLIYNFYLNGSLAFTRHIKGRFFPVQTNKQFSLENDDSQTLIDQFVLETQRTLDYGISQVFRRPIDFLLIDAKKEVQNDLIELIEQVTEVPVNNFESKALSEQLEELPTKLSLAEAGVIFSVKQAKKPLINFYFPEYHPKPLEFGLKFASGVAAAFLLIFTIYGLFQEQKSTQLEGQLVASQQELDSLQASLVKLQNNRSKNTNAVDIDQRISQKQTELNTSRQLLKQVNNKTAKELTLYSHILSALAKQQVNSLWLTKINLQPSAISLEGSTNRVDSIPNYINQMSENKVLNRQFVDLKIKRDEVTPDLINFEMIDGRYLDAN